MPWPSPPWSNTSTGWQPHSTAFRPFDERVRDLREAAAAFDFLQLRISEWELLQQSAEHPGECAPEIRHASHWLQRKLADESASPAVLQALAEDGGTRKIRNIARDRTRRLGAALRRQD